MNTGHKYPQYIISILKRNDFELFLNDSVENITLDLASPDYLEIGKVFRLENTEILRLYLVQ